MKGIEVLLTSVLDDTGTDSSVKLFGMREGQLIPHLASVLAATYEWSKNDRSASNIYSSLLHF